MEPPRINPAIRDVMSVLAYLYLLFDKPDAATKLLAALARLDRGSQWAQRAHCLALLLAGRPAEAAAAARALLEQPMADADRVAVLRVLVKACWRLGEDDEARAYRRKIAALAAVTVLPNPAPGRLS
jgi:predicted Zn-dependent protease